MTRVWSTITPISASWWFTLFARPQWWSLSVHMNHPRSRTSVHTLSHTRQQRQRQLKVLSDWFQRYHSSTSHVEVWEMSWSIGFVSIYFHRLADHHGSVGNAPDANHIEWCRHDASTQLTTQSTRHTTQAEETVHMEVWKKLQRRIWFWRVRWMNRYTYIYIYDKEF